MKVKLTLNIGAADAKQFGLPETAEGAEINVPDTTAEALVKRGWATPTGASPPPQPPVQKAAATAAPKGGKGGRAAGDAADDNAK